jgi:hypothetical protein
MRLDKQTASTTKVSLKLNKGQSDKLLADVAEIAPHLKVSLPVYLQASPAEREALLAHSPVLSAVVKLLDECGAKL